MSVRSLPGLVVGRRKSEQEYLDTVFARATLTGRTAEAIDALDAFRAAGAACGPPWYAVLLHVWRADPPKPGDARWAEKRGELVARALERPSLLDGKPAAWLLELLGTQGEWADLLAVNERHFASAGDHTPCTLGWALHAAVVAEDPRLPQVLEAARERLSRKPGWFHEHPAGWISMAGACARARAKDESRHYLRKAIERGLYTMEDLRRHPALTDAQDLVDDLTPVPQQRR